MSSPSTSAADGPQPPPPIPRPLIPSLPDDVATNIVARVPRSHHPILSLVSKPIKSFLLSPHFFALRSNLNATQSFLYLSVRTPTTPSLHWYTLHRNPQNPDSRNTLVRISPTPLPTIGAAYAVVGPNIYVIGGSVNDVPSSHIWVLDCRFHKWEMGPRMRVAREFAAAGVVNGKIYVMGGCNVDTFGRAANWAEVLDPVKGKWEAVESPVEIREKWMHASAVVDGKIYAMADRGGVVYDPETRVWEGVNKRLDLGWRGRACVIDGVLYCYDFLGKIRGFVVREGVWKEVRGVERGLPRFLCGATMANVGGKLVVVWEGKGNGREMEIWCAEIEVRTRKSGDLWGKISWYNKVLMVPSKSSVVHCLAVTL